ncbi:unnamed protein product [Ranitomeya imitator]|uniref:Amine oxidase domain-containing protein n=1 Tax=Ranitomeya imitator TaxID=111125 RepID=A0ABN9L1T0_9NEOB|nr:unnamed protein product [Ranitomeya imitator]
MSQIMSGFRKEKEKAGVLKKRAMDFFSPILPPGKLQAIKNLGFGTNNKILLEYEKPFWDPNTTLIQPVWEGDSPLTEAKKDLRQNWMKKLSIFVVLEPPKHMGHVLCGFIAGEESEFMETLTDEEVLSSMTDYFRRFTVRNKYLIPYQPLRVLAPTDKSVSVNVVDIVPVITLVMR